MKVTPEEFRQKLESRLGAGTVEDDSSLLQRYSVDGKPPTLLCSPTVPEQVALTLRICSEVQASIVPWGGGTAMAMGNPPHRADLVLRTERLNCLIEHDRDNLTATVQSGLTLAGLHEVLAGQRQFLPIDAPCASRATVGGTIAANLNGARRSFYGGVRDLVIGMKVALASGEHIKAGGKVVKNVAGYDMCKLFVGSLGTLGVITEATLRLAPLPETAATVIASGGLPQALRFVRDLSRSKLHPAALVLSDPRTNAAEDDNWAAAVAFEGFAETVARQLAETQVSARNHQLSTDVRRDHAHHQLWDDVSQFPLVSGRIVYRLNIPPSSVAACLSTIQAWTTADFEPAMVIDVLSGVLWISVQANRTAVSLFAKLLELANHHRGYAIMSAAPPIFKTGVDVWGSTPRSFSLMCGIKRQFDPLALLNPGRFVAGL